MSNHSSVLNARYKSIVSARNKKYLAKCKSMFLCGHAPWCGACPHMECGPVRACPVYLSTLDNLPGHLAICVHNIIIMCIGLVHDIFTRNIYYGTDINIYN